MVSGLRMLSCSAVLLGAGVAIPTTSAAANCESLASLELPDVTSITAKSFPGGTFQPPDPAGFVPTPTQPHASPPISNLPAFCEVSGAYVPETPDTGHPAFAPNNGWGGGGFALNQPADPLNVGLIQDFAERSEL